MEAVGRLSGGVAHDFNNLLTVIQGNVGVGLLALREGMTQREVERVAGVLAEIEEAAQRASKLTGQLLTFSRKHVSHLHVLNITDIVRDMQAMLRRLIRADIAFEVFCERDEHFIQADRAQIEQVLVNLVVNASDAMPDGGKLTILVENVGLDEARVRNCVDICAGPCVLIAVSDTGIGMERHTLEHLFEPFFTTKPYGQGTGLGLSIVYGIVKNFGGCITVDSTPGAGSTFRVYFPAVAGDEAKVIEPVAADWEGGRETILLCEDEASLRRLAAAVLTEAGYAVIEAENGEEAVRLAREHAGAFQLLITDVVMPGIKGDKVAEAVLKDQPGVAVLFMSGYALDVVSIDSLTGSGFNYLQKPFKPTTLLRTVRRILNRIPD